MDRKQLRKEFYAKSGLRFLHKKFFPNYKFQGHIEHEEKLKKASEAKKAGFKVTPYSLNKTGEESLKLYHRLFG